jgi:hypothetical protein
VLSVERCLNTRFYAVTLQLLQFIDHNNFHHNLINLTKHLTPGCRIDGFSRSAQLHEWQSEPPDSKLQNWRLLKKRSAPWVTEWTTWLQGSTEQIDIAAMPSDFDRDVIVQDLRIFWLRFLDFPQPIQSDVGILSRVGHNHFHTNISPLLYLPIILQFDHVYFEALTSP